MIDWLEWLADALGASRYYQHAVCLYYDPLMMTAYAASDLSIWASYMVIGYALLTKRHAIADMSPAALFLYGTFIFLCGLSHLTKTLTLFTGVYRLDVLVVAATAGVSVVTAGYTVTALWFDSRDHVGS